MYLKITKGSYKKGQKISQKGLIIRGGGSNKCEVIVWESWNKKRENKARLENIFVYAMLDA